jgi:hypothetical protein
MRSLEVNFALVSSTIAEVEVVKLKRKYQLSVEAAAECLPSCFNNVRK